MNSRKEVDSTYFVVIRKYILYLYYLNTTKLWVAVMVLPNQLTVPMFYPVAQNLKNKLIYKVLMENLRKELLYLQKSRKRLFHMKKRKAVIHTMRIYHVRLYK